MGTLSRNYQCIPHASFGDGATGDLERYVRYESYLLVVHRQIDIADPLGAVSTVLVVLGQFVLRNDDPTHHPKLARLELCHGRSMRSR